MPSTVIRSQSYDAGSRQLFIEFTTSRLYYFDVPESEVAKFRAATSKAAISTFISATVIDSASSKALSAATP